MTRGCRRIAIGLYLAVGALGGRPGRARRFLPVFASMALRYCSTSFAVIRRACSKGNAFAFFIASPFSTGRLARADDSSSTSITDGEDDDHHVLRRPP